MEFSWIPSTQFGYHWNNKHMHMLQWIADFENMSCEMIFGQIPPDEGDDPAVNQPCYLTLCKILKQSINLVDLSYMHDWS